MELAKPFCRGGGAKITERSIKDSSVSEGMGGVPIISQRGGGIVIVFPILIPYFPRYAVAIGTEGIVIEGEFFFVCTEMYVGFGSGDHKEKGLCRW